MVTLIDVLLQSGDVSFSYSFLQYSGNVDEMFHIYTGTALGRGRVASPMLGRLCPRVKPSVLIL